MPAFLLLCGLCQVRVLMLVLDEPPAALVRMQRGREAIQRADIRWSHAYFSELADVGPGERMLYGNKIAGGDIADINDGTEHGGYASFTEDHKPIRESRAAYLRKHDQQWEFESDQLFAVLSPGPPPAAARNSDARVIGLLPFPATIMSVEDACRHYPPDKEVPYTREYSERVVGGIHEVEMRIAETGMTLHWWIDPEKGWNPIRTQLSVEGRVVDESRVEYQKCGDTWFPRSVDYVDASGAVMSRIEVEQARINSPDLPTELFPEDIGLGIGMSVTVTNETGGEMHSYMGHGKTLVDEEYLKLYAAGRVVQDPRLAERASVLQARAAAKRAATDQAVPAPVPASAPAVPLLRILEDDWERYTREFIQRYSLDASQIQTAELILRECQEQRSKYLRQKARQISSIRERATGGPNAEARRKALAELDEFMEPLTRIFEAQLKPRLDRLPTRAQRQGVKEPGADENRP